MPRGRNPKVSTHSATPNDRLAIVSQQAHQPAPVVRYRRSADRRTSHSDGTSGRRTARPAGRIRRLVRRLPDSLRDSPTAVALLAIVDLELDGLAAIVPPLGYGRD